MSSSPRPPQSPPMKRQSNVRLHFPGSTSSSPNNTNKNQNNNNNNQKPLTSLPTSSPQTARPSTTGGGGGQVTSTTGDFALATFDFPTDVTSSLKPKQDDDHEGSLSKNRGQHHSSAPSMHQQLGYAIGEASTRDYDGSPLLSNSSFSGSGALPSIAKNKSINFSSSRQQQQQQQPQLNSSTMMSMSFGKDQAQIHEEAVRREKAASALAEALLKWPSTSNPVRAPTAEATVRRRIATSQHSRRQRKQVIVPSESTTGKEQHPTTMAETVLDMIDLCNSNTNNSSTTRRNNNNTSSSAVESTAVHPSHVKDKNGQGNDYNDENDDENEDDGTLPTSHNNIKHKYPPHHHRPAQRDFLSWSSGAATGFESFTSVSRWVDWVLQEAQFHSSRIEKETGDKHLMMKDALDLAEVMRSNFDGLLVDAATYYEEIQQRATQINECIRAWTRGSKNEEGEKKLQMMKSLAESVRNTTSSTSTSGPGDTFLVRAAFLVLDRVLSGSTMMNSVWPLIRNSLLKGLYVKGDAILHDTMMKKLMKQQQQQESTNKNSSSSSTNISFTTEELSECLANNSLIMEQYDDLLAQFRDAERQRFHLESTTSQLSAFSDLTARHASRRLIRSAFKAWRQIAQQGKVSERLIVHFSRQAKAKEIVGRNLHRWRSYMQLQRRNRAMKYSDEIRRKMNEEKASHQEELRKIKEDHERTISNYEIRLLHLQQQYDAAVEGAHLERTTLEGEIEKLNRLLDKAEHHVQQWRTAALLSRPTEGNDAIALYSDDEKQKQAVKEMALALAPPSKKLQVLISAVRGTEDALYLATIRTSQEASRVQAAKLAAQRRQLDGTTGAASNFSASIASPTQASLARLQQTTTTSSISNLAKSMSPKTTNLAASLQRSSRSRSPASRKNQNDNNNHDDANSNKSPRRLNETIKRFEVGQELPSMDFGINDDDDKTEEQKRLQKSLMGRSNKPAIKLFVKDDDDETAFMASSSSMKNNNNDDLSMSRTTTRGGGGGSISLSASIAQNLRSSTTASALQARPEMNFQSLAAAAREALTAFLVEWVNEMLARSSHGRNMMHAGVTRTSTGTTIAKTITNLDTDLYDGSVYLSLCKVLLPAEHQRKGDADVFSTIVSTLFVFTAHGLQPPLIVHCPFYRRFFRADTFGTFIHPTAGLWIVGSLFCGYALRSAQSPNYRSHPALSPVHQYSPSGHHKVSKQAARQQQQQQQQSVSPFRKRKNHQSPGEFASSTRNRRQQKQEDELHQALLNNSSEITVTRPPMNILIMSGVNTCGYGTKKAFTTSMARGDAALLQRLGVSLDKTIASTKETDEEKTDVLSSSRSNTNNQDTVSSSSYRRRRSSAYPQSSDGTTRHSRRGTMVMSEEGSVFGGDGSEYNDDNDYDDEENQEEEEEEEEEHDDADEDELNNDNDEDDEDDVIEEIDDTLPGEASFSPTNKTSTGKKKKGNGAKMSQKEILDSWLLTREAVEAAQKAVPEHLLNLGPTELLQYWRTAQENRSIWIGMARVVTSLAVRFRVFDIDTKRTEQNTARRHMQSHMTSTMTSELKVDSTSSPSKAGRVV